MLEMFDHINNLDTYQLFDVKLSLAHFVVQLRSLRGAVQRGDHLLLEVRFVFEHFHLEQVGEHALAGVFIPQSHQHDRVDCHLAQRLIETLATTATLGE